MATTYDYIAQNKWRTALLVLFFPVSLSIIVWGVLYFLFWLQNLGGTPAYSENTYEAGLAAEQVFSANLIDILLPILPLVWIVAVLWLVISWYVGAPLVISGAGAKPVSKRKYPDIYNLVENLCISRGLPTPEIYIMQDSSLNAFATGRDPEHAIIALTSGIIEKLDRAELEGVIAHELSHVENRDIRLMLLTVAGISLFTMLAEILLRIGLSFSKGRNSKENGTVALFCVGIGIALTIFGYIVAPLIRLAISRTREYQADATAALMTRNPAALASALRKISADPRVEALDQRETMAAMCIANPLGKMGLFSMISGLWATHPPIEKRIAALMEMDGRI
jgi:heat shock protein HtpX